MPVSAPLIYSPRYPRIELGWGERAVALGVALACLAPLVIAATLTPDPSGMGTHTQLNLEACSFYARTGLPCPTCGMTTSFAWFARGNLLASLYIQPMGTLLALLAAGMFWLGLYIAVTGRAVHRLIRLVPTRYHLLPLLALALAAWVWKIFIHTHGLDGWRP